MADTTIDYAGPVVTLADARTAGLKRYFISMRCPKGHLAQRHTVNQACVACTQERKAKTAAAKRKPKPPAPPVTIFYEGPIVSLSEAKATGAKAYFLGTPCPHGHIALRSTSSAGCRACEGIRQKRFRCEQAERARARDATYRTPEHKEKARQYMAARLRADPEGHRAREKAKRLANPEIYRTYVRNRRARRDNAEGSFTTDEFLGVLKAQKWRCAICKISLRKTTPTADHIKPLSKGGSNYIRNIQALCKPCNSSKHASDPIDHAQRLGLLL